MTLAPHNPHIHESDILVPTSVLSSPSPTAGTLVSPLVKPSTTLRNASDRALSLYSSPNKLHYGPRHHAHDTSAHGPSGSAPDYETVGAHLHLTPGHVDISPMTTLAKAKGPGLLPLSDRGGGGGGGRGSFERKASDRSTRGADRPSRHSGGPAFARVPSFHAPPTDALPSGAQRLSTAGGMGLTRRDLSAASLQYLPGMAYAPPDLMDLLPPSPERRLRQPAQAVSAKTATKTSVVVDAESSMGYFDGRKRIGPPGLPVLGE